MIHQIYSTCEVILTELESYQDSLSIGTVLRYTDDTLLMVEGKLKGHPKQGSKRK